MNVGVELLFTNLGMAMELSILLVLNIGVLIFMAKDVKLGLILAFFINACITAWFYVASYNYAPALIITFLWFILMSLSLYAVNKANNSVGGFIG